jgi:Domain of unknown function (DUF3850)
MIDGSSTSNSQPLARKWSEQSTAGSEIVEHTVKCWPQFFDPILSGKKTHDLRRSDDRDFRVGDVLHLQEFEPETNRYTGRELRVKITYITSAVYPCALSEDALHPDFCILSIKKF